MADVISQLQPSSFSNCPTESSVNALKSLLSLPAVGPQTDHGRLDSSRSKATPKTKGAALPQNTPSEELSSKKTSRVPSPQNLSPDSKTGSSKKSKKAKKKKSEVTTPSYFAGSAFQNSPDPVSIPIPSFDDDAPEQLDFGPDTTENISSTAEKTSKTVLLRRLLKVEK